MDEELYHYGVKGMKWGIRRTPQQLGRKIEKLDKKNAKLAKRINPKDTEKADRMQQKASKAAAKAASARAEANKNQRRVATAKDWGFDAPSFQKRADKANKAADRYQEESINLQTKVNAIRSNQRAILDRIHANESMQAMYRSTINGLNDGTIKQGRFFMQYVREYD